MLVAALMVVVLAVLLAVVRVAVVMAVEVVAVVEGYASDHENQMMNERMMNELAKTSTTNKLMIHSAPIAKNSLQKAVL